MSELPPHAEKVVREHEEALTKHVREQAGRDDLVVVYDRSPLLRFEKERRWPDDFRGFGSNVRPKRQK